jgi:hypothetical protein
LVDVEDVAVVSVMEEYVLDNVDPVELEYGTALSPTNSPSIFMTSKNLQLI